MRAKAAALPQTKMNQVSSQWPRAQRKVIIPNVIAAASAIQRDHALPGSDTYCMFLSVTWRYEGTSQNAMSPYASAAMPAARSQTKLSRWVTRTLQARMGKKMANAAAP